MLFKCRLFMLGLIFPINQFQTMEELGVLELNKVFLGEESLSAELKVILNSDNTVKLKVIDLWSEE